MKTIINLFSALVAFVMALYYEVSNYCYSVLYRASGQTVLNGQRQGNLIANYEAMADPGLVKRNFINYLVQADVFTEQAEAEQALKSKVVADFMYYHALNVTGAIAFTFFDGNAPALVTNLNDFQLPKNEHALIFGVNAYEGINATLNNTVWTPGIAAAELQNGQFSISSNDTLMLKNYGLIQFTEAAEDALSGQLYLMKPIIYLAQNNFSVPVKFFTNPIANQNMMIVLNGLALI